MAASTTEIERKFLAAVPIEHIPAPLVSPREHRQGYLALDPDGTEVRVRLESRGPTRALATLTVKRGAGTVRDEVNVGLDDHAAAALWAMTEGRRLVKVRHLASLEQPPADLTALDDDGLAMRRHAGLIAEIDVYEGSLTGLVVIEVEFGSTDAAEAFVPPAWFGPEVTGDRTFRNNALSRATAPPVRVGDSRDPNA